MFSDLNVKMVPLCFLRLLMFDFALQDRFGVLFLPADRIFWNYCQYDEKFLPGLSPAFVIWFQWCRFGPYMIYCLCFLLLNQKHLLVFFFVLVHFFAFVIWHGFPLLFHSCITKVYTPTTSNMGCFLRNVFWKNCYFFGSYRLWLLSVQVILIPQLFGKFLLLAMLYCFVW